MRLSSFVCLLLSLLMLNTSCSYGEDLEQEVLKEETAKTEGLRNSVNTIDNTGNAAGTESQIVAQAESDGQLRFPNISSLTAEIKTDENGQKIIQAILSLKNGSVEDFDISYKWFHQNEEIFGEIDNFIVWSDEYKKGDVINVNVIPEGVPDDSPVVLSADVVVPNSSPVITSEPPLEIKGEEKLFEYKVEAEDPDGDNIEIDLKNSPAGMSIEPATGLIKWDFSKETPGTEYNIEIIATDTDGGSYTQQITLTIPQEAGEQQENAEQEYFEEDNTPEEQEEELQ